MRKSVFLDAERPQSGPPWSNVRAAGALGTSLGRCKVGEGWVGGQKVQCFSKFFDFFESVQKVSK